MWYCPCPRSFFRCTCPVHSLASATLGQPGPQSLRGMAPIPICCHVPLFVFMPLFIPPRPFLLSPPLWLVAVERDPSPICMLLLHVHGAQEQPSRKLPPSPQWHESCFCWPRSGPFLHMAHVPVQKLSNRRWRGKARRGKVLQGAMRASCQRAIGRFEAPRLQGSATPRPHVPPSPQRQHINYLSPVLRLLLFFLLQLQTGCLPSKPRLAVLRAQFQLSSTNFLNTIFLTAWNSVRTPRNHNCRSRIPSSRASGFKRTPWNLSLPRA